MPPLGTLLFQFSSLLHPYFQSKEAKFADLVPVTFNKNYQILNAFLSKLFFLMMKSSVQQTGNNTIPLFSLFDIPQLLAPNLPDRISPFIFYSDFSPLCDDFINTYLYAWLNHYNNPKKYPPLCQADAKQVNFVDFKT
jgi:hypothetical protein